MIGGAPSLPAANAPRAALPQGNSSVPLSKPALPASSPRLLNNTATETKQRSHEAPQSVETPQVNSAPPPPADAAPTPGNPMDAVAKHPLIQKTIELLGARVVSVHPRVKRNEKQ